MLSILIGNMAVGAIVGIFTYIALRFAAWLIMTAISAIAGLIRRIREKIAFIRKGKAAETFIKKMAQEFDRAKSNQSPEERNAIKDALNNLQDLCQNKGAGLVTPLDDNECEHWEKVKIVAADDSTQNDMPDACVVTEDEKWAPVMVR
jgi:hypothetical protein